MGWSHTSKNKRSRTFDNLNRLSPYKYHSPLVSRRTNQKSIQESQTSRNYSKKAIQKRIKEKQMKLSNLSGLNMNNSKFKETNLFSHLLSKDPYDFRSSSISRKNSLKKDFYNSKHNLLSKKDAGKFLESRNVSRTNISIRRVKSSKINKSPKKKKKGRVEMLFVKDNLKYVDFKAVVDNWTILLKALTDLNEEKDMESVVNTYFLHFYKKQYEALVSLFSNSSNMKLQVEETIMLEFWAFYLIFYFKHEEGVIEPDNRDNLKLIIHTLIKSVFYIGLILNKARKSAILKIKKGTIDAFNNHLKIYNFPIGVGLIRSLKEGNDLIKETIKPLLKFISRRVRRKYDWSMEVVSSNFEEVIGSMTKELIFEFQWKSRKKFVRMNPVEFFLRAKPSQADIFKNNSDLMEGSGITFHNKLNEKLTPAEFFANCLDETLNSNSQIRASKRKRHAFNTSKLVGDKIKPKRSLTTKSKNRNTDKSVNSSRLSNNNSIRGSKVSGYRTRDLKHKSNTSNNKASKTDRYANRKNRSGLDDQYQLMTSFTNQNKTHLENLLQKDNSNNYKFTKLLSDLSVKYQPLSNVSKLRESALSIKKMEEEMENQRSTRKHKPSRSPRKKKISDKKEKKDKEDKRKRGDKIRKKSSNPETKINDKVFKPKLHSYFWTTNLLI